MKFIKGFALFCFGGIGYGFLEILWRGGTHISMFFVGGFCFLLISLIDAAGIPWPLKAPLCAAAVTAVEFVSGMIVNVALGLKVWDYSSVPLNFMGQICLPFSAIWLLLSFPASAASRLMKRLIFMETPPKKPRLIPVESEVKKAEI